LINIRLTRRRAAAQCAMSTTTAAPNPRLEARRDRLIDAAQTIFTREGLRGATMERIAAEAGVARATAYVYFTDKEDAFLQVCRRLADQLAEAVSTALAAPGPLPPRIRTALQAKHSLAWRVARQSPFAADLIAAKDRLAAPIFAAMEIRIINSLAAALAEEAIDSNAAPILLSASKGVAAAAQDHATLLVNVATLSDAMLRGLGARS
jgi:AcrR family transcriptional regulator